MQKWIFSPTSSLPNPFITIHAKPSMNRTLGGLDEWGGWEGSLGRSRAGESGALTGAANDCGFTRAALIFAVYT